MSNNISRLTVTGACGNLGWKLLCHLVQQSNIEQIFGIGLDVPTDDQYHELNQIERHAKVAFVQADLTDHADCRWHEMIERSDAVVHFAAQNPFPEATWEDAVHSLDMTLNVAQAAVATGTKRFIFASSNHVMGRYKDFPLNKSTGPGKLTTDLEHAVGTVWTAGDAAMDSTIYAVAKSSGERACRALALQPGNRTEFVCARIGWCQPGDNHLSTLSGAGTPTQDSSGTAQQDSESDRTDRWFKSMWLSNGDFLQLFSRALFADSNRWPELCIVVNAMSRNEDMPWSLKEASEWLGYEPHDGFTF